MAALKRLFAAVDRFQRGHRAVGIAYGVVKKFGNDNANLLVVSLGWYGFLAIFPLLLVVVTIFGFIGIASLGTGIVSTLHHFPVVGSSFNPEGSSHLRGSVLALVIGLIGLLYGAQGVTQTAQQAMASVWNVPEYQRSGFLPRLGRSLLGLSVIGGAFVINAIASTYLTGSAHLVVWRALGIVGMLLINVGLYLAAFRVLTPGQFGTRCLLPGSVAGGAGFTLLITVGAGLLTHELKNTSTTYGAFGSVIGIVAFLLLLAKVSIYAAELNPVVHRSLYPRAMPFGTLTAADRKVLSYLAQQEQSREEQIIAVEFGSDGPAEHTDQSRRPDTHP